MNRLLDPKTERVIRDRAIDEVARSGAHRERSGIGELILDYLDRDSGLLRPWLVIATAHAYGIAPRAPDNRALVGVAAATELLHVFALLHDDHIDREDRTTRHAPGSMSDGLRVLAGDFVHELAWDLLDRSIESGGFPRAIAHLVRRVSLETIVGQQMDVAYLSQPEPPSVERLLLLYDAKTARYSFVAPLCVGALAASPQCSDIERLDRVGILLGRAYQLVDDAIDSTSAGNSPPWERNLVATLLGDSGRTVAESSLPREILCGVEPILGGLIDAAHDQAERASVDGVREIVGTVALRLRGRLDDHAANRLP